MKDDNMDFIKSFYNNFASEYDKLFLDWQAAIHDQAKLIDIIFQKNGFNNNARILDCACGIGTQAIGLALIGYNITASDISIEELAEAKKRALENHVEICFKQANFCALSDTFSEKFDIIIAMDNALPHMLSSDALNSGAAYFISDVGVGW